MLLEEKKQVTLVSRRTTFLPVPSSTIPVSRAMDGLSCIVAALKFVWIVAATAHRIPFYAFQNRHIGQSLTTVFIHITTHTHTHAWLHACTHTHNNNKTNTPLSKYKTRVEQIYNIYIHTYIYIYIHMCVCVCVCACVRACVRHLRRVPNPPKIFPNYFHNNKGHFVQPRSGRFHKQTGHFSEDETPTYLGVAVRLHLPWQQWLLPHPEEGLELGRLPVLMDLHHLHMVGVAALGEERLQV